MVSKFTNLVIPLACDSAGTLNTWTVLDFKEIVNVWNLVFGNEYPISNIKADDGSLEEVVKHLVRCFIRHISPRVFTHIVRYDVGSRTGSTNSARLR